MGKLLDYVTSPVIKNQIVIGLIVGGLLSVPLAYGVMAFTNSLPEPQIKEAPSPPPITEYIGRFNQETGKFWMQKIIK